MNDHDQREPAGSSEFGKTGRSVPPKSESPPRRPFLGDDCLRFIQFHAAFEDQRQPGSYARQHIDNCKNCQQYFARVAWDRKKEEELLSSPEVEALVAEYARRFRVPFWQRRRVQLAAGILILIAAVSLILMLAAQRTAAGRNTMLTLTPLGSGASATPNLDRSLAQWDLELDRAYTAGGTPAIAKIFAKGSVTEIGKTVRWIIDRQHTSLISTLVGVLSDPRLQVRALALNALRQLPILAVKPHQATIAAAAATETNPDLALVLQSFATDLQNAR